MGLICWGLMHLLSLLICRNRLMSLRTSLSRTCLKPIRVTKWGIVRTTLLFSTAKTIKTKRTDISNTNSNTCLLAILSLSTLTNKRKVWRLCRTLTWISKVSPKLSRCSSSRSNLLSSRLRHLLCLHLGSLSLEGTTRSTSEALPKRPTSKLLSPESNCSWMLITSKLACKRAGVDLLTVFRTEWVTKTSSSSILSELVSKVLRSTS